MMSKAAYRPEEWKPKEKNQFTSFVKMLNVNSSGVFIAKEENVLG